MAHDEAPHAVEHPDEGDDNALLAAAEYLGDRASSARYDLRQMADQSRFSDGGAERLLAFTAAAAESKLSAVRVALSARGLA